MYPMVAQLDVLYVEDDPHMIRLVSEAFAESSIPTRVHGVTDGLEARAFLAGDLTPDARGPDLVLLDKDLGAECGLDLIQQLRDRLPPGSPVVVFSGSDEQADIELAYARGANAYVQKPSDFEALVRFARGAATFWQPVSAASTPT